MGRNHLEICYLSLYQCIRNTDLADQHFVQCPFAVIPKLTIEGFVVTMFDGRTKVHTQVLNQLKEHFTDMVFDTIIQRNIRLSEAPSHGKPIILYDVMSNGTSNYLNLAKEVLEKNEKSIGDEQ